MKRARHSRAWIATAVAVLGMTCPAAGEPLSKRVLVNLRFEQKLNAQVPLGLEFRDESGARVQLREFLGTRPVILLLGYYGCPMLCGFALNGLVESLQVVPGNAGKDFDVLMVSIDPSETPALAAGKKEMCLKRYGRSGTDGGWHFLVGAEKEIQALADAVGFQFAYDAALKEYAHPSGIVVLTPEGRTAKYLFGVNYPAKELNTALLEAAENRAGSPVQAILMLCFQNMPLVGEKSAAIMLSVRVLAVMTVGGLATFMALAIRRDRRARSKSDAAEGRGGSS